jgi:hypothetical protein
LAIAALKYSVSMRKKISPDPGPAKIFLKGSGENIPSFKLYHKALGRDGFRPGRAN